MSFSRASLPEAGLGRRCPRLIYSLSSRRSGRAAGPLWRACEASVGSPVCYVQMFVSNAALTRPRPVWRSRPVRVACPSFGLSRLGRRLARCLREKWGGWLARFRARTATRTAAVGACGCARVWRARRLWRGPRVAVAARNQAGAGCHVGWSALLKPWPTVSVQPTTS